MVTLFLLPLPFWLALATMVGCGLWAWNEQHHGIGYPVLMILGTIGVWYIGDVFYNDYAHNHAVVFSPEILGTAWWQVTLFVVSMTCSAALIHRKWNRAYLQNGSWIHRAIMMGKLPDGFQRGIASIWFATSMLWLILVVAAIMKLGDEAWYYFFPFIGAKRDPWGRAQIGGGWSAVLSLAHYSEVLVGALLGVVWALDRRRPIRWIAGIQCILAWFPIVFDRTRKNMIAVLLPAMLCWTLVRLRVPLVWKFCVIVFLFACLNAWFLIIISQREGMRIDFAELRSGNVHTSEETRHEGLNMYEELCWINSYLREGTLHAGWGTNYFANLVNPIPRAIWPGKPLIGLDYAAARGEQLTDAGSASTVSHGSGGQGVVNFGLLGGPAVAGLLMGVWACALARLDLRGAEIGRLPLYVIGITITFEFGRDITMLTLYPYLFGFGVVWLVQRWKMRNPARKAGRRRMRRAVAPRPEQRDDPNCV